MGKRKKVLVAMSGGVDSSATAALLKEQGYDLVGITMQLFSKDCSDVGTIQSCCGLEEIADAKKIAQKFDFPHYVLDFKDIFKEKVINDFCEEYKVGRTPNPCIRCNRYLKFDILFDKAQELGCDFVATGHYVRVLHDETKAQHLLMKGVDSKKDQSYVLYVLKKDQLKKILMPLGGYTKVQVREIAHNLGLSNATKAESQEICFIPDNKYQNFLQKHIPESIKPGNIKDSSGKIIGKHKGIPFYTIGQRRGMGIAAAEPLYVTQINVEANELIAGPKGEVYSDTLIASDLNWISIDTLTEPMEVKAKIRYLHHEAEAIIQPLAQDKVKVVFNEPQWAITRGQAVVFYDGDIVVGGGTIE